MLLKIVKLKKQHLLVIEDEPKSVSECAKNAEREDQFEEFFHLVLILTLVTLCVKTPYIHYLV